MVNDKDTKPERPCAACHFQDAAHDPTTGALPSDAIAFAFVCGYATAARHSPHFCQRHAQDLAKFHQTAEAMGVGPAFARVAKLPEHTIEVSLTLAEHRDLAAHVMRGDQSIPEVIVRIFGDEAKSIFDREVVKMVVCDSAPANPADCVRRVTPRPTAPASRSN